MKLYNIFVVDQHEMLTRSKLTVADIVLRINTSNQTFLVVKNRYGQVYDTDWLPMNLLADVLNNPSGMLCKSVTYSWKKYEN